MAKGKWFYPVAGTLAAFGTATQIVRAGSFSGPDDREEERQALAWSHVGVVVTTHLGLRGIVRSRGFISRTACALLAVFGILVTLFELEILE